MEDCSIGQGQLCESEYQTLESFVATSHLYMYCMPSLIVQWPARIFPVYCSYMYCQPELNCQLIEAKSCFVA